MEDLLKVGVITTTHGVRGEVKVFPTTDDAERFLDIGIRAAGYRQRNKKTGDSEYKIFQEPGDPEVQGH